MTTYKITLPTGYRLTLVPFNADFPALRSLAILDDAAGLIGCGLIHEDVVFELVAEPTPEPVPTPTPTPALVEWVVMAVPSLKVRSTPAIEAGNVIGNMPTGAKFLVDSNLTLKPADSWLWARLESGLHKGNWVAVQSADGKTILAKKSGAGG